MNIVVVSDFAHVNGGNAAVALGSAVGLAARGHAVTLFAGAGPVDERILASSIDVVCTDQYSIADDPRRLRAMVQGVWNAEAARAMARLLGRVDLDSTVVHVHGWDKVLSSSVVRTALSMGAKVVCTYHDYVSACPTGGFTIIRRMQFADCSRSPEPVSLNGVIDGMPRTSGGGSREVRCNDTGVAFRGM